MSVSPDAVLAVVAEESGLDLTALRPDVTFEQLDISSIDIASTLFAIEDKFGVIVDPDALNPASTISEFVALVIHRSAA